MALTCENKQDTAMAVTFERQAIAMGSDMTKWFACCILNRKIKRERR